MERRRQKILNYYIKNQDKSLEELSGMFDLNRATISSVITEHINNIRIYKEFGFCYSISFPEKLGYFYDDISEREVILENNEILNLSDFNEYELFWLKVNYNLGHYIEKKSPKRDIDMLIQDLEQRVKHTHNRQEKNKLNVKLRLVKSMSQ